MPSRPRTLVLLAGLGLIFGGCGEKRRRAEDTGYGPDCAEGYLADGSSCVPEACGTGTWGDLPVDGVTVHVSAHTAEGGDGTEEAPLLSIQAGLDLAGERGGGLVAVAAGSYSETLALTSDHAGVRLAGRCRELATLDASVGDDDTPGIDIDSLFGEVEVSGLGVLGSRHVGVRVRSGVVRLVALVVEGSALFGIGAYTESLTAPTSVQLEDCEVVASTAAGVLVYQSGTQVSLADTVVRDTRLEANGAGGTGILVWDGATLTSERCEVFRNQGVGIWAHSSGTRIEIVDTEVSANTGLGILAQDSGAEVHLVNTLVRDTRSDEGGEYGYGVQVGNGAALMSTGTEIVGNTAAGLKAAEPGSSVALVDTVIRNTEPNTTGEGGFGILISDGATLSTQGCELVGNRAAGMEASGSSTEVVLMDTVVRDTLPNGTGGRGFGMGFWSGATLLAEGCDLVGNTSLGISAADAGTVIVLTDTLIRDTLPDEDGVSGFGIEVFGGATVTAVGCGLTGNTSVGIAAADRGTEVALVDSVVQGTLPDGNGEFGHGIEASLGARLEVEGCQVTRNSAAGMLAVHPGTRITLRNSTISGTTAGFDEKGMTAAGLVAQQGACVTASGLLASDNEGPGLYATANGSLSCVGCKLGENHFAGAVALNGGTLEIKDTEILGTRESANLGGGAGVWAAEQWDWEPPSLVVRDCIIADNRVAGVWMAGVGSYELTGTEVSGNTAIPHGATIRCGDGVYATGTEAWTGTSGLLLSGNTLSGNQGSGLFLDDGQALLAGNAWTGNAPDLWVQGDACLAPGDDWTEAPTSEICPEWDRPVCQLEFALNLLTEEAEAGRSQPMSAMPTLQLRRHRRQVDQAGLSARCAPVAHAAGLRGAGRGPDLEREHRCCAP